MPPIRGTSVQTATESVADRVYIAGGKACRKGGPLFPNGNPPGISAQNIARLANEYRNIRGIPGAFSRDYIHGCLDALPINSRDKNAVLEAYNFGAKTRQKESRMDLFSWLKL